MGTAKPIRTAEFRRNAVRIALTSGLPRRQVAKDLGVDLSSLNRWVASYREGKGDLDSSMSLVLEHDRLLRENRILREEIEILQKAAEFFEKQKS